MRNGPSIRLLSALFPRFPLDLPLAVFHLLELQAEDRPRTRFPLERNAGDDFAFPFAKLQRFFRWRDLKPIAALPIRTETESGKPPALARAVKSGEDSNATVLFGIKGRAKEHSIG